MQSKPLIVHYKFTRKEFFISPKTKPSQLMALIKRAFQLTNDIRALKVRNTVIGIEDIFAYKNENSVEVVVDDPDQEHDMSQSEVCSQRSMSRRSGRKFPPSQSELLESKFYLDDFQLFMAEIDQMKSRRLYGILFFNSRKKVLFLGKKILRELIWEFDEIEFFYALHPIKRHTNSVLLGETCVFCIFRGTKLIHEREFSQRIAASSEIIAYINGLYKAGKLDALAVSSVSQNQTEDQRSFDYHSNRKDISQSLALSHNKSPHAALPLHSPAKSALTNQISFDHEIHQPTWFTEGNELSRLEKAFVSTLIKTKEPQFGTFCQGLDLKSPEKRTLSIKLVKVFIGQVIVETFKGFSTEQLHFVEENQQNRQSFLFSALLRLQKFGSLNQFMSSLQVGLKKMKKTSQVKYSFVEIAEKLKAGETFKLRLKNCEVGAKASKEQSVSLVGLIGKVEQLRPLNSKLAALVQQRESERTSVNQSALGLQGNFSQGEIIQIEDMIGHNDYFLQEQVAFRDQRTVSNIDITKKYVIEKCPGYSLLRIRPELKDNARLRQTISFLSLLQLCLVRWYIFQELRVLSKKQKRAYMYLYLWSDLNLLGAFELYASSRDIEDFVDTLFLLDYNYYVRGRYGVDLQHLEDLTAEAVEQLIIIFVLVFKQLSVLELQAVEAYLKAGDLSIKETFSNKSLSLEEVKSSLQKIVKAKKAQLDAIQASGKHHQLAQDEKNRDRCAFLDEIVPVHFKNFKQVELACDCVCWSQPNLTAIFDVFDQTHELTEWIESFELYILDLPRIHRQETIKRLASKAGLDQKIIDLCQAEMILGVYEVYLATKDEADAIDSLERLVGKCDMKDRQ